jgi:hypothetical protein
MTPTTRFRYVERTVPINETTGKRVHILQQWWEVENITDAVHNNILDGEWRDIPLEQEA